MSPNQENERPERTGRIYTSVVELMRGEDMDPEVIHMTMELIARDQGVNNPETDQRVDLPVLKEVTETGPQ